MCPHLKRVRLWSECVCCLRCVFWSHTFGVYKMFITRCSLDTRTHTFSLPSNHMHAHHSIYSIHKKHCIFNLVAAHQRRGTDTFV